MTRVDDSPVPDYPSRLSLDGRAFIVTVDPTDVESIRAGIAAAG